MQRGGAPQAMERFLPRKAEAPPQSTTESTSRISGATAPGLPAMNRSPETRRLSGGRSFSDELNAMIEAESRRQGVNPDLVRAVVRQESGGNPRAISRAGAIGLMQLMPDTARQLGVDPYDPQENLQGGIRYLRDMAGRFQNVDEALAAYNAGPGAVQRHGGIPPYQETQNYVRSIRRMLRANQP